MSKLKQLRIRCFFDVSIAEDKIGRVIFELFNDVCPKTCENFKALCTGEKGSGKFTGKPLHYKNVTFHRVVKNFMIQSGDFSQGNGKGGESIYGGTFADESFEMKHEKPFLLSMANRGKNTNGSQFFITLAPAPHLDGVHVVFGHVISGEDVVMQIANQAVDKHSKPLVPISISNCGELIPQIKQKGKKDKESGEESSSEDSSDSSSSSSGSESDSDSSDDDSRSKSKNDAKQSSGPVAIPISDLPNAPKVYSNIKPDEIPEVPTNRFLSRNFKPKEPENSSGSSNRPARSPERSDVRRKVSISKSGRKIKGRGFIRYRTPSPRDDRYSRFRRSETPPHWKTEQAKLKTFKEAVSGDADKSREDSRNRSRNGDRYRRERSRSRERHSYRSSRHESRRDHSQRRSKSPDLDRNKLRKRSRSSSEDADKDKRQKENQNANSSSKSSRDKHRDERSNRSKHDRDRSSSPAQSSDDDSSPRHKSSLSNESKQAITT